LVLVTHDRYWLDRVSTLVLGLDGRGGAERFADYSQWDVWRGERARPKVRAEKGERAAAVVVGKKKASYLEAREYEGIEERVHEAERVLELKRGALQDPGTTKDGRLLEQAYREVEDAQAAVDAIYARWAELEEKIG
jgi:ABC transport system ATP-binding/permease protein